VESSNSCHPHPSSLHQPDSSSSSSSRFQKKGAKQQEKLRRAVLYCTYTCVYTGQARRRFKKKITITAKTGIWEKRQRQNGIKKIDTVAQKSNAANYTIQPSLFLGPKTDLFLIVHLPCFIQYDLVLTILCSVKLTYGVINKCEMYLGVMLSEHAVLI
jgi:hypothetical protein